MSTLTVANINGVSTISPTPADTIAAYIQANTGRSQANTAYNQANNSFSQANVALAFSIAFGV